MPTTTTSARGPAAAVRRAIAGVRPIVTMWRDGLTVIPLISAEADRAPEYLTFGEAQESQAIEVQEADVQVVPTVDAATKGPTPVLILGGDTIIGGAQNRIINITILLKAASKTAIPVSCLEVGRWNDGRRFASAAPVDHAMRAMVAEQVTRGAEASRGATPRFAADQGAIWHEIDERQGRASMHSPTQALHDLYRSEEQTLEEMARAFPMPAGARGVAIGIHDRMVGLDLFDSAATLERQWPRLIGSAASALLDRQRAIAADAVRKPRHRHVDSGALDRMLERATTALADAAATASVGLGHDVRFTAPKLVGTALVHDRRAIHVALFRPAA